MIPQQLIASLKNTPGFDETAFIQAHQSIKPLTSIRFNSKKIAKPNNHNRILDYNHLKIDEPIPWCNNGYYLQERPSFTLDPLFHAGVYYVQEASSMFLWHIVNQIYQNGTNKIVLDLCAAPGGKTTLLSDFFNEGLVVSNEVIKQRVNILSENVTKWGNENVVVINNDPKDFKALNSFFDAIIIDAPCSGSGLFRKDKEAIKEWSENNVNLCQQRQKRIISDTYKSLKHDGYLIYSTCSYSKQENEEVVDWILENYNASTVQINFREEWGIVETLSEKNGFGYRFFPDKVKGEGFFIAVFKNNSENSRTKFKESLFEKLSKSEVEVLNNFLHVDLHQIVFKHQSILKIFPKTYFSQLQILAKNLYIKKAGIDLGMLKGKDLIPSHELAISNLEIHNFATIELNLEQVLQYLSKNEVIIHNDFKGWILVTYLGYRIGWIKVLDKRINNYYPSNWRIIKNLKN